MEDNKNKLYGLLTLTISVLALSFSGISLYFSYDANKIAKESQYQSSRPRIQLKPAELPGGGYFFIEGRDNKFHIKIQCIARNSGFTPATNVTYIKEIAQLNILDETPHLSPAPKTSPSIGPSQEYFRMFSYVLAPVNYSPEKMKALASSIRNKEFTAKIEITVQYYDEKYENRHTTHASYEFGKSNVKVIEYEEK